jgi:hypothetical protein
MLNSIRVIVRALCWHHNRQAALPAETLAVAVLLAEDCPSTDNGYTRLRVRHPLPAAEQRSELENAKNQAGGVWHLTISLAVE